MSTKLKLKRLPDPQPKATHDGQPGTSQRTNKSGDSHDNANAASLCVRLLGEQIEGRRGDGLRLRFPTSEILAVQDPAVSVRPRTVASAQLLASPAWLLLVRVGFRPWDGAPAATGLRARLT